MPFLVFGGDPFVQVDIREMLAAEFPGVPVVAAETEDDLFKKRREIDEPMVAVLAIHNDVVRITKALFGDRPNGNAVILIRNDPPDDEEKALPLHHLTKPFSGREFVALVKDVLSDRPEHLT